jgi:ADP-ribose pyrophosphatase
MDVVELEVLSDERVGEGGFLSLRRLRVVAVRENGTRSSVGLYDFVERPMGLDAVVLALWHRGDDGRVRVLVRDCLRVPLVFGRPEAQRRPPQLCTELVAGILERGDVGPDAVERRAADEALEEAGLTVAPSAIQRLGPPVFPTPGMCAERFHLLDCEVDRAQLDGACVPEGDGSPFEEGARLRWLALDDALAACRDGAIDDLKTEVTLRRLAERLA